MRAKAAPITAAEAYSAIAASDLYEFHTDNPAAIVRAQIRRHSEGLSMTAASKVKHFRALPDGRFELALETLIASVPTAPRARLLGSSKGPFARRAVAQLGPTGWR